MTARPFHPSPATRPKVTVIVAIYGVEAYMDRCARSLFEQTLDDIEYIFIDDCTPDRSMVVLQKVLSDYPQRQSSVKIHKMEKNSGLPAVREWGLRHASGEFITHCDSDDWVEPDAYRQMYETALREKADIVVCDYDRTDGTTVFETCCGCTDTDRIRFMRNLLLQKDSWSVWNKLVSRNICCREDLVFATGNLGEDMVLTFQFVFSAGKVSCLHRVLYHYFANPDSLTHAASEDKKMTCFRQNKENADIVFKSLRSSGMENLLADGIMYAKWCIKQQLLLTCFDTDKFRLWRSTYSEIDRHILLSRHISFKEKIKYLLTRLHIYPFHRNARPSHYTR